MKIDGSWNAVPLAQYGRDLNYGLLPALHARRR